MGSGGHNRYKGTVESYHRLDSYEVAKKLPKGNKPRGLKLDGREVLFSYDPANYGGYRVYFLCPVCGKRVRFLYLTEYGFICRAHLNANYNRQQMGHWDKLVYDMHEAIRPLGEHYTKLSPHDLEMLSICSIPRPKYMREATYRKHILKFVRAKNRCIGDFMATAREIISK